MRSGVQEEVGVSAEPKCAVCGNARCADTDLSSYDQPQLLLRERRFRLLDKLVGNTFLEYDTGKKARWETKLYSGVATMFWSRALRRVESGESGTDKYASGSFCGPPVLMTSRSLHSHAGAVGRGYYIFKLDVAT